MNIVKRFMLLGITAVILVRQIVPISQLIRDFPLNDFSVYLDGARETIEGRNPYLLKFFDRYNYPPAATVFFIPLTKINVNAAEFIFTVLSIISLWLIVSMSLSALKVDIHWTARLLLFSLVLKSFPVKLTLVLGQINIIILFLVIGSWFMERRGKPMFGDMLLGLATAIKLTPGPLILYFLVRRKIKFVMGWLEILGGLGIVGIIQFGWEQTRYFYLIHLPKLLSETTPDTLNLTYMNQSLLGLLGRLGIFEELGAVVRYGIVATMTLILLKRSYRPELVEGLQVVEDSDSGRDDMTTEFRFFSALLIVVFLFLPSFVWQHHFVALIPAWLVFVSQAVKKPRSLWTVAVILGYVLLNVSMKDPYLPSRLHPLLASHFTVTAFFFLILLLFPGTRPQKQ